ncbi:NAD-dependent epimerase/dehydratase family protein [Pajaroellobacter abortibovis]|uniref:NAD-dependent epimerase/dehydratase domain-containing protein n=1 Tax=Pajaroellobacter abortibovis TaxID=1882918 RepID=A0A1L6MYK1_9BACT|nr:NAD-dependent epimerase/dehydratase family protein [Pajaroellobacter abortibovis]APS00537.1 hypothetical protein BCY86_07500 [Pajaroellobacter abortibovis]
MKIFVTGGSGFLGSHVVEQLIERGYQVRALVRATSNSSHLTSLPQVELVEGGLGQVDQLANALRGVDGVIHCAGLVKARNEVEFFDVNVKGTQNLLSLAARHAPSLKRFVLVSSLEAVGPSPDGTLLDDQHVPNPVTCYGRSKLAAERVALAMKDRLPLTIVRPTGIYGPRDKEILSVFQSVARGVLPMFGEGYNTVSMIYASDAALACIKAFERDVPSGSAYFINDGVVYTWREALEDVERALGKRAIIRTGIPFSVLKMVAWGTELFGKATNRAVMLNRDKLRGLLSPHWVCSSEKAQRDLDWLPTVMWPEGTRHTVQWYREHGWL